MTLVSVFASLPAPTDDWDGRHALGPPPEGLVTLSELADGSDALNRFITCKRSQAKGGDARLGCAYLIGDLGWEIGRILGGLWLGGWRVAGADPAAVALTTREVAWEVEGESGVVHVLDLTLDPAGLTGGGTSHCDLARAVESLHAELIATLARTTRLGQAAQWRLVGDGLGAALIELGRRMGRMDEAVSLGRALLAERATRLRSPQTEIVEIRLAHRPEVADWFRLRGAVAGTIPRRAKAGNTAPPASCATATIRSRA